MLKMRLLLALRIAIASLLSGLVLEAATYLPMADGDLARGAPIIARATVVSMDTHLEAIAGEDRPVTLITLRLSEAIKGWPGDTFVVRLPGGRVGDVAWWIPGTPAFAPGQDVVLMLGPQPGHTGQLRLTEFGLSKFDLTADDAGKTFAVRPAFAPRQDLLVSKRAPAAAGAPVARDAESFLAFLRATVRGEDAGEVGYASPVLAHAKWVNIGGREPGDCQGTPCLFRWFWDTGASPNAVLSVTGTQTNLVNDEPKCGIDFTCDVQNAASAWHAVATTDIRLSGPSTPGNISVKLDAATSQDGTTWTTPLACEAGVIGLGGPGSGLGPKTYRGESNYFSPSNGTVSMRKITCNFGYSAATFRAAVLHEVGHVLGLGHPDDDGNGIAVESIHSTTSTVDINRAVMDAVIDEKPDTPQVDDTQAVQYYYGTAAVGPMPVANFTFSPASPTAGSVVTFTSTGGATGWNWDFGDAASSTNTATTATATHIFTQPQTFSVKLTAGNLNGANAITRPVTVAVGATTCTPNLTTLCLNAGRFQVTVAWKKPDQSSGNGTGVRLTPDSGYFWFFDSSNIEAVVKVLNGCGVNTNYWVFTAGLTNVEATVSVLDTRNGTLKQYVNPQGTAFAPTQDTKAFATCP
jgi:PKD repeat protein